MGTVKTSASGTEIHTPAAPKRGGKISNKGIRMIKERLREIRIDPGQRPMD